MTKNIYYLLTLSKIINEWVNILYTLYITGGLLRPYSLATSPTICWRKWFLNLKWLDESEKKSINMWI